MTDDRHLPPRLHEQPDPALRELSAGLELARGEGPSAEQLARICARVSAVVATGNSAASTPHVRPMTPTAAWLREHAVRLSVGALLLAGVVAMVGVVSVSLLGTSSTPQAPHAPTMLPPSAAVTAAMEQQQAAIPPTASQPTADVPVASRKTVPIVKRSPASTRKPPSAADDPDTELTLLKRARAHVHTNPTQALVWLAQHASSYPRGIFAEEREVLAIEALLATDRGRATSRARAFLQAYPGSAHTRRVNTLLEQHGLTLSNANRRASPHP